MPKLTIDGYGVEVPEGSTILQAAEQLSIEIPIFCYHSRLSIAGNCRMCLVEVEKTPKPVASCAMPVSEGMVVHTLSPMVEKARKGALEFLLINHPLDCPICDQGGECDLQDITVSYGKDRSRFGFYKRAVPDKNLGPLVKTSMNRCIHCTRCVRFSTEVAGISEMGAIYRGEHTEITSYLERSLSSELSGNVIDLCPVGALTSKPYAFKGRSWELTKTESVDVMDAMGSNIRIDTRGREVMRILPRVNEAINEEWISDKTRFACDGLKYQRLDKPYIRNKSGYLEPCHWDEAFQVIASRLKRVSSNKIAGIVGDLVDAEAMVAFKDLMTGFGTPHVDCRQDGAQFLAEPRCSYLFNTTIQGLDQADFFLLVGTNPRVEAPVLNARIRKNYVAKGTHVGVIGAETPLTYPATYYGNTPQLLESLAAGKASPLQKALGQAKYPVIILGASAFQRPDSLAILGTLHEICERYKIVRPDWNGFNVLHTAAARVGGLDLGLVPGEGGLDVKGIQKAASSKELQAVYLLGADELQMDCFQGTFVIYQGHHGDRGAQIADVVLPGAAYTEKDGLYVNTEGRVQRGYAACMPPGEAREDWKILRALMEVLGMKPRYDTLEEIRQRLGTANPIFQEIETLQQAPWSVFGKKGPIENDPFQEWVPNFYMTNTISRHSVTMAACTQAREAQGKNSGSEKGSATYA
ncbi:MAG: NADH-quinone oxidoreductase subunit NuoG [Alphaproteobacteria bacterium]